MLSVTKLNVMPSVMVPSTNGLLVALSISHNQYNATLPYTECLILSIFMLNVIILSAIMLSVIMLSVILLNVIVVSVEKQWLAKDFD